MSDGLVLKQAVWSLVAMSLSRPLFWITIWANLILVLQTVAYAEFIEPQVEIYFIDVGEGAATLIKVDKDIDILLDTGNPTSKIVSKLKRVNTNKIDHLFITHPHVDHFGGVFSLLDSFPLKNTYDNGENLDEISKNQDIYRHYLDAVRLHPNYKQIHAGFSMDSGHFKLQVISPSNILTKDWNTNSLVVKIGFGEFRALLMADGNLATEQALLNQKADLRAHIIQIGHHGAGDATSKRFIKAVDPEIAIISVNKENINRYPAPKTLKILDGQGINVHRTDKTGTIKVTAKADGEFKVSPLNLGYSE